MKGQLFIDEKDAYLLYGASLIKGAYEALLTPAAAKEYPKNQSRLEHGSRIVAAKGNFRYSEREVTLNFFVEGKTETEYLQRYEAFMEAITSGIVRFRIPKLGKTYKLVYSQCSKYGDYGIKRGKFAIKFIEPNVTDRS